MELFNSIIGVLIIVIGWFVGYFLSKRQDAINKRKEMRINYLINAWRSLESASNRENNDFIEQFETSIADIQLFGTKKQIELAQKFAVELSKNKSADNLDLLIDLRNDLRKELQLEKVSDTFKFLRIVVNKKHINTN